MNTGKGKPRIMADINITPFTDVVLVLLIVFMVATPVLYQSSLKVELPRGTSSVEMSKDIIISIDSQGNVIIDDNKIGINELKDKISDLVRSKSDPQVIVDGDKNVRYDYVIRVMDILTQAGIKNPGLGIEMQR